MNNGNQHRHQVSFDSISFSPLCFFPPFSLQELTEEGIPFLILFHVKDDAESLEKFQHEVARQLITEKGKRSVQICQDGGLVLKTKSLMCRPFTL